MKLASIFALALLAAVPALAQPYNTSWVSHTGADNGSCGPTSSPCRTFQGAYNNTNAGGIIKAMDAGEYGKVDIEKAIVIDGNGVGAVIEVSPGLEGVFISGAGRVEIRNLAIHVPFGCLGCGAIISSSSFLSLENVSITGAITVGIYINRGLGTIHGLTVTGATDGIDVFDATVTISDSSFRYSTYAIHVTASGATSQALIERTKMISNSVGLWVENAGAAATARISECVITSNTTGTLTTGTTGGGQIITFRNNTWAGNGTDGSTPFSASLK